jgi:RHS repeat-associated protein
VTLTSGYNAEHSRTSLSDNLASQGLRTLSYDTGQRLTTITTSYGGTAGPQVVATYDPGDRLTALSRTIGGSGTAINSTLSYDAANRQTTITHYIAGGAALATYGYSYDSANRVTSEKDAEGTASITYDNSDELTGVTGSRTENYGYDLNGNRNGTGYHTTVMNETDNSPGHTYTFDNAGNMISDYNGATRATYTYDYRNRVTSAKIGGVVVGSYTYDALDRRIGIKENGTQSWTVYDGINPYADFNSSGTLTQRYLFGPGAINGAVVDELLARTSSGGSTAWYLPDKLGSVRDIVDNSGSVLDHVVYDSFGNIVTETNAANGDRFKFAGMEWDAAISVYYDRARYYDSAIGRFSSLDSMGFSARDVNLYRYVTNGPTNSIDPTGFSGGSGQGQSQSAQVQALLKQQKENAEKLASLQRQVDTQRSLLRLMQALYEQGLLEVQAEDVSRQAAVLEILERRLAVVMAKDAALYRALGRIGLALVLAESRVREMKMIRLQRDIEYFREIAKDEQERIGNLADNSSAPKYYAPYVPTEPWSAPKWYGTPPQGLTPLDEWWWFMNQYVHDYNPNKPPPPPQPTPPTEAPPLPKLTP